MSGFCEHPDCAHIRLTPREGSTLYCATRNKAIRKQEEEDAKPDKKFKPIKRRSDKRADQEKEYTKLREGHLKEKPVCEVCGSSPSVEIHHRRSRNGEHLNEVQYFLAVCDPCHKHIHDDPEFAKENGYMLTRSV